MAMCLAAVQRILGFVRRIIGKMTIEDAEHREYNFKVHFILDELDQLDERLTSHDVQRLIGLGIKFIPTPRPTSVSKFMESFEKLLFGLIRKVMADDKKDKFARKDKELATLFETVHQAPGPFAEGLRDNAFSQRSCLLPRPTARISEGSLARSKTQVKLPGMMCVLYIGARFISLILMYQHAGVQGPKGSHAASGAG
jgi:hypothetical protein